MEKKASELEESIQFNEDDISDLKKESKESKFEINDLLKQLLYLETYSRRENVKFLGCTVYFSKAQPDKLFVNGKFIPANAPLTDFV